MNFAEQPPSKQWAVMKYRGEPCAEVWFKPDGEPFGLTFRIPPQSFSLPDLGPRLSTEMLLKAVGLAPAEVEAWHHAGAAPADMTTTPAELGQPLPVPAPDVAYLQLHVRLKPPPATVIPPENSASAMPEVRWQELEVRWNAILNVEGSIETFRLSVEAVRAEMEAAAKHSLRAEEKLNASSADVAQWTKAKSRVVFVLPKAREYIHRATWATSTPERKKLEELYKNHIRPRLPFPEMNRLGEELDILLKDRQVLAAHGVSVHQECKSVVAEVQATLRTLLSNATAKAHRKRVATHEKGKYK